MTTMTTGIELGKQLVDAGLIPAKTTRLSIDIAVDEIVTVTFTTFADQRLLDAVWPHLGKCKRQELLVIPLESGGYVVKLEDNPDLRTMQDV